jgi:hypothetical protein
MIIDEPRNCNATIVSLTVDEALELIEGMTKAIRMARKINSYSITTMPAARRTGKVSPEFAPSTLNLHVRV